MVRAGGRRLCHRIEPRAPDSWRCTVSRRPQRRRFRPTGFGSAPVQARSRAPGAHHHGIGPRRRPRGPRALNRDPDRTVITTMNTSNIQGVPDLGPGLRLHLNENTGGCSPAVVDAIRTFDARGLATYPDYRAAVIETAEYLGVEPDWLVLTNGLDEGILLTSLAYLGSRTPPALVEAGASFVAPAGQPEVVMAMPAFEPYVTTARAMGARIVSVPPAPNYAFPVDGVIKAVTATTRLVYVNNPNNPTGQPVSKEAIRRVIDAAGHALVFLDEAYHDFMGDNFLAEAGSYPNVIVGRTFSKAHGLAGLRIGVMV